MLQILKGKEKSALNVILDSSNNKHLTYGILKHILKCDAESVMLCFQSSMVNYNKKLGYDSNKIQFYDNGYRNFLNWEPPNASNSVQLVMDGLKTNSTQAKVVVVDDLLLFGRHLNLIDESGNWNGLHLLIKTLSQVHSLFLFLNPNLTSDANTRSLVHLSSFHMNISTGNEDGYPCRSVFCRPSGKVIAENVTLSFKGAQMVVVKQADNKTDRDYSENNEVDPTSNLTFNLRLSEAEKKARANVVLPYLLDDSSKASYLNNNSNLRTGGNVTYTPDDADDFDDEDPDDDLDI